MRIKIVIVVEGGIVQSVYSTLGNVEVGVIDLDEPEFADEEEMSEFNESLNTYATVCRNLNQVY